LGGERDLGVAPVLVGSEFLSTTAPVLEGEGILGIERAYNLGGEKQNPDREPL